VKKNLSIHKTNDKIVAVENQKNQPTDLYSSVTAEIQNRTAKRNRIVLENAWSSMESEIASDADLDRKHTTNVTIKLGETDRLMTLVFQRKMVIRKDGYYIHHLDLYEAGSDLRGRAPSGLMIIWSVTRKYHRVSITELRTLDGYSGNGLGAALLKLADSIITTKLLPLTTLDQKYKDLPIIALMEDTAHDSKGKVSGWTTFQAVQLGYAVTGKNDNGWPVLTKTLA